MKKLLQLLKDKEITIDYGTVDQEIEIYIDNDNYFQVAIKGFYQSGEGATSLDLEPSFEVNKTLDVLLSFECVCIDGIELEWTDDQKLAVYEILKEKFEWQFDFVELNY